MARGPRTTVIGTLAWTTRPSGTAVMLTDSNPPWPASQPRNDSSKRGRPDGSVCARSAARSSSVGRVSATQSRKGSNPAATQ